MTNRIGPMDQGLLGKIGNSVGETKAGSKVESGAKAPDSISTSQDQSGDTVNLTNDAKLLERLDKTLQSLPAINAERVSEIKAAIEGGNYEIDADAIADAMVRLDRSLGD